MNIHEYQAKSLLRNFGIPVPNGIVVESLSDLIGFEGKLSGSKFVVKSQIHAGGRGAGFFKDDENGGGGVTLVNDIKDVEVNVKRMLNNTLVTKQTGVQGKEVKTVYIEEACEIGNEFYLSMLVDRKLGGVTIICSTEGGMEIEEVAENTPEKIIHVNVDSYTGMKSYHVQKISKELGFSKSQRKDLSNLLQSLFRAFLQLDAAMIEINPLVITKTDALLAIDAKMSFDDNALFRQPEVGQLRDESEEEPTEIEAAELELNYIKLDGNIGCLVNGAGLAMATMDIIKLHGGDPANFLDVGGSATKERVAAAFKIIMSDENVSGILVNIFGGIMRCDIIAEGVVSAAEEIDLQVPLVVRLEGTNVEKGKSILAESGLPILSADNLSNAAQKIVDVVGSSS
tara:strand:- start:119 stop:1315 length:1197 start_codon:yes stop_codon:yes gene_type:complete